MSDGGLAVLGFGFPGVTLRSDARARAYRKYTLDTTLGGLEVARTEYRKYGKTSCKVFNKKIDYASAEVSTYIGFQVSSFSKKKSGLKMWISYSQNYKRRAISET